MVGTAVPRPALTRSRTSNFLTLRRSQPIAVNARARQHAKAGTQRGWSPGGKGRRAVRHEIDGPAAAVLEETPGKRRPHWPLGLAALLVALIAWNAVVAVPVMRALSDEQDESTTIAYRRWLISPSQIVFDVWKVAPTQSMVAMDRRLFKAAEALQGNSYEGVVLAHKGRARFIMDGPYFQEIGATRQTQNPIYTIRTMQEHLTNPDGSEAFGAWTGGLIGVLGEQMEDHTEFHRRWWINDELGLDGNAGS